MTVAELIQKLKALPQDRTVLCQVVGQESGAWNMAFDFVVVKHTDWIVQLRVEHPCLKSLPMGDELFKGA